VAVLLNGHPDLLDEFTGFLPVGTIDLSNLDDHKEQKTCAEKDNRERRSHDEDHKDVRKAEVAVLLNGHPDLLDEFTGFVASGDD
ncbi:hypothetical protein HAX54_010652, partial [Datura stramonium]|nr:hypothetical protein [Datura stramonium]